VFYTYIFQFLIYDLLLNLPGGAPVAPKNGLVFGACILAGCLGAAAYIQYTAPNLVILL